MSQEPEKPAGKTEPETVNTPPAEVPVATEPVKPVRTEIPPYVGICLLIAAVLVVLLVVMSKARKPGEDSRHKAAVDALSTQVEASMADLNNQRVSVGLSPIPTGAEPIDEVAKRLSKDSETIVGMANSFQNILKEKDVTMDAKNAELIRSEQSRQNLVNEISRLQQDAVKFKNDAVDGTLAKRELADMHDRMDRLNSALLQAQKDAKSSSGNHSDDEYATLQRRYEETQRARDFFEKRTRELEAELAKLRIFAKSEGELLPEAVELFRTLRGLEGKKDSDNMTAYSEIGAKLGANVLRTLNFPTGSSEMTAEDQTAVRALIDGIPDGDLVLVVGYASTTGNVETNRQLSSDRATAVAQTVSGIKRPGQLVQAVYIGQTDRFSSKVPESNQICEVWQIRKK